MKKIVCLLFLFSVVFFSSSALATDRWSPVVENGGEFFLAVGAFYNPEVILEPGDEPIKDWNWTTSNKDVASVFADGSIIGSGYGTATLTGEAKDGSGRTAKIKATMKKIYTTHDSIVVDTPDGVDFGYILNASGFNYIYSTGDCFSCEPLEDVNGLEMSKIMPVKTGTDSLVFESNGRKIKTVKITVKKSAFETAVDEMDEEIQSASADGEAVAVVKKDVNIRSKASADSKKVGSAKKGDKLVVTKAYYSDKWHQILYGGQVCYVSANYCDIKYIEQTTKPTATPTNESGESSANGENQSGSQTTQIDETSVEGENTFTVEHDEQYEATKKHIWDFLEEKGYKVQTIIGTPNIGRYEDNDPTDNMEPWYAFVDFKGEWTEFLVMLYDGEVSMIRPNK